MKSNLLSELERSVNNRSAHRDFPIPNYLFVQKYGRTIQKELEEIAKVLGWEDSFYFKTEGAGKKEAALQRFRLEEERHAGLGRNFSGCVLIEITGTEEKEELFELLEYLEAHQQRISSLFTTKNHVNMEFISNELEQFFFLRMIDGMKYEPQEQLNLFQGQLFKYGLMFSGEAEKVLQQFLEQKVWQESDMVEKRIQHLASHIVYTRQLMDRTGNVIEKEEMEEALQKEQGTPEKKRTIGFVTGG